MNITKKFIRWDEIFRGWDENFSWWWDENFKGWDENFIGGGMKTLIPTKLIFLYIFIVSIGFPEDLSKIYFRLSGKGIQGDYIMKLSLL